MATPILIGNSRALAGVRESIRIAARSDAKVLITGETGVGKEVVATLVHHQSARHNRRFVAVNCSGLPDSLLESELFGHVRGSFTDAHRDKLGLLAQADRGTLFLDELGEMSLRMQAMLLRFTETGEVQRVGADTPAARTDVRLITATNRDLRAAISEKAFREDLYYRLNVIQIRIPALRERADDIPDLLHHYLARAAETHEMAPASLAPDALRQLQAYAWPGNVRELRNVTERLTLLYSGRAITAAQLPDEVRVASGVPSVAAPAALPTLSQTSDDVAQRLWTRLQAGEDFWAVVHQGFRARQLTKADLTALIDRGLRETCGSYRGLLRLFNLPPSDYKRMHAFLYQQQCNLPVRAYRQLRPQPARAARAAVPGDGLRSSAQVHVA